MMKNGPGSVRNEPSISPTLYRKWAVSTPLVGAVLVGTAVYGASIGLWATKPAAKLIGVALLLVAPAYYWTLGQLRRGMDASATPDPWAKVVAGLLRDGLAIFGLITLVRLLL